MTERNDYPESLFEQEAEQPADRRQGSNRLKTRRAKNLFRLGVSCLSLMLVTALVLVSGSFSYFSSGETSTDDLTPLTAAAFGVEVEVSGTYAFGQDVYGDATDENNHHYVAYAFDVRNESQVPVKCNIELNIAVRYTGEDIMENVNFYFCEDGGTDSDAITNFDGETLKKDKTIVLAYNTETDGSPFDFAAGDTKTFVLVADCNKAWGIGTSTASNHLLLSNNNPGSKDDVHAITVTAEQATGEGE